MFNSLFNFVVLQYMTPQVVQLNLLKITTFLNQFEMTIRYKLSMLNERLNKLERLVDHCEAARQTITDNN